MRKILHICFWLICITHAQAQTYKTGVLVYGENNAALAAALQAAKSGANTTLMLPNGKFFLKESYISKNWSGMGLCVMDTILKTDNLKNLPKNYNDIIFKYLDTLKNLIVIKNIDIVDARRKGNFWYLKLNANTEIKADEIVDASYDHKITQFATHSSKSPLEIKNIIPKTHSLWQFDQYKLARTQMATSFSNESKANLNPFGTLLVQGIDHLVQVHSQNNASDYALGQAAGVIAAYGSFFKDQTPKLFGANLRIIQSELLDYHLSIFDLEDITVKDKNWLAIQHTLLCGFFTPQQHPNQFKFESEKAVKIAEIKPVLQNMYFKTAIWFEDQKLTDSISVDQAIALVCYLGNKGYKISRERIEKNWNTIYEFDTFTPNNAITRVQFAVLVKDYLTAFPLKIDFSGKMKE